MSTTTEMPAAPTAEKRQRKINKRFMVTLDGVPCGRASHRGLGIKLVPKRGSLIQKPNDPDHFPGMKTANRAIARALRLRARLRNAVCAMPATYAPFMRDGEFAIVKYQEPRER